MKRKGGRRRKRERESGKGETGIERKKRKAHQHREYRGHQFEGNIAFAGTGIFIVLTPATFFAVFTESQFTNH